MKCSWPFSQLIAISNICLCLSINQVSGEITTDSFPKLETSPEYILPGTYLVVGAFSIEANAQNFTGYITQQGLSAHYAYYPVTGYYYVYTFSASKRESVIDACLQLRENTEFEDAWVFVAPEPEGSSEDDRAEIPKTDQLQVSYPEPLPITPNAIAEEKVTIEPKGVTATEGSDLNVQSVLFVRFSAHQNKSSTPIKAKVKVVDGIRSKNIAQTDTEKTIGIDKTKIMDSVLQIIPYAIGFRREQFDLPIYFSEENSDDYLFSREEDTLTMQLPLHRLKKGDIQVMYNTYYHSNSSVMRERSRYELDQLVDMLNENPSMRIKLHGHTNGGGRGFTYLFKPEEGNFFDLRRGKEYKKNGVGSVKLSALRAETIKSYLEKKGIAADRLETQGWGGKRMLYPPDSPLAKNNIRVEIEVLSE